MPQHVQRKYIAGSTKLKKPNPLRLHGSSLSHVNNPRFSEFYIKIFVDRRLCFIGVTNSRWELGGLIPSCQSCLNCQSCLRLDCVRRSVGCVLSALVYYDSSFMHSNLTCLCSLYSVLSRRLHCILTVGASFTLLDWYVSSLRRGHPIASVMRTLKTRVYIAQTTRKPKQTYAVVYQDV